MKDWMNEGKRLNESLHVQEACGFYGNGAASYDIHSQVLPVKYGSHVTAEF